MKLRILSSIGFISLLLANVYALVNHISWLNILTHIGFYVMAFIMFFPKHKSYNFCFYLFLGLTILSYLLEVFDEIWYFRELSLFLQAASYLPLILEANKHFVLKYMNYLTLIYFFSIIGLNTYLLLLHTNEINTYLPGSGISILYTFYYLSLGGLGIIALLYYLNSYSKKSLFFISMVLCIIFANVLRDMGVFYFKDLSVEISESLMRMGSALFLVLFFVTSEKKLRLVDFV